MHRAAAVSLLLATSAVAAPVPKALKKQPTLDGRWELVELMSGGTDLTALNPEVWEIAGEQLTVYLNEGGGLRPKEPKVLTTLVRPNGGGPNHVDYVRSDNPPGVAACACAAEVRDNELVFCFGYQARPTDLKPSEDVGYYRFKRLPRE